MNVIVSEIKAYPYTSKNKTYHKFRVKIKTEQYDEITAESESIALVDKQTLDLILFLNQMLFDAVNQIPEFFDWFRTNVSAEQFESLKDFAKTLKDGGLIQDVG